MFKKKSNVLLVALAVILFVVSLVFTGVSIKAGQDYKVNIATYNLYRDKNGFFNSKIEANAESALQRAEKNKDQLIKSFAVSLLLYLAIIIIAVALYMKEFRDDNHNNQIE